MSRRRTPRRGDGTAWLAADRPTGEYLCSWYTGVNDDRLVEQARVMTASDAVAWGRLRTSRVRIRTGEARSYWAGTAPKPDGFTHTWADPGAAPSGAPAPAGEAKAGPRGGGARHPGERTHPRPLPGHDGPISAPRERATAAMGHRASESRPS